MSTPEARARAPAAAFARATLENAGKWPLGVAIDKNRLACVNMMRLIPDSGPHGGRCRTIPSQAPFRLRGASLRFIPTQPHLEEADDRSQASDTCRTPLYSG